MPGTGSEIPSAGSSVERATVLSPPSPGTVSVDGQRRPQRKAHSLIDKVYRWENLWTAWRRVRANKGAHGLDRVTIKQFEANCETHLREIQRKLMERRYEPQPVRRVYIPKTSDPKQRRPLGIPVVADRIVGQALLQVLDPLFDTQMSNRSFGFRKGRKAHQAIATVIADAKEGFRVVIDADIASFLETSSQCTPCVDLAVEEARKRVRHADPQALSASGADMNGVELAALYTMQHRLARHAEDPDGVDDGDVAFGRIFDEARAQIVGDADTPRRPRRELLCGDEPVVDPAVDRRSGDAEDRSGLLHGDELALVGVSAFAARNAPVRAKAADPIRREAQTGRGLPAPWPGITARLRISTRRGAAQDAA